MKWHIVELVTILLMCHFRISEGYCVGSLSFSKKYLSRKANFTKLICEGGKGSTICVAKRKLDSKNSELVDFRCPPEERDIVQCDLAVSESNPFACQYYHHHDSKHSKPSLMQHCCCYKQACMEPIARVEYQQRHLHRIVVNPETAFLFWMTIIANIMTAVVFFDQIVGFFIDIYERNWGCNISKRMLKRKNLYELQAQLRKLGLWEISEQNYITLMTAFIGQKLSANYRRQSDLVDRNVLADIDIDEIIRGQFFRKQRSVVQGSCCAGQLVKICNSSWRGRERMSMGDRRRKKIVDIETLLNYD